MLILEKVKYPFADGLRFLLPYVTPQGQNTVYVIRKD